MLHEINVQAIRADYVFSTLYMLMVNNQLHPYLQAVTSRRRVSANRDPHLSPRVTILHSIIRRPSTPSPMAFEQCGSHCLDVSPASFRPSWAIHLPTTRRPWPRRFPLPHLSSYPQPAATSHVLCCIPMPIPFNKTCQPDFRVQCKTSHELNCTSKCNWEANRISEPSCKQENMACYRNTRRVNRMFIMIRSVH